MSLNINVMFAQTLSLSSHLLFSILQNSLPTDEWNTNESTSSLIDKQNNYSNDEN